MLDFNTLRRRYVIAGCLALVLAFFLGVALIFGFVRFADHIPQTAQNDLNFAEIDAAVVYTGGSNRVDLAIDILERIFKDIDARQAEDQRRGFRLFISGAQIASDSAELIRAFFSHRDLRCCVDLGFALNTRQNGQETALWANNLSARRILLVTSDYHMHRSLFYARLYYPDAIFIPFLARPSHFSSEDWRLGGLAFKILMIEYAKWIWAQMSGPILKAFLGLSGARAPTPLFEEKK